MSTVTERPFFKREADVITLLAFKGHQVHKVDTGYLVCWQGYARHCCDLESLEQFARQVGAIQ